MDDLKGLGGELPENIEAITYEEAIHGRERLVEILNDAGVEELDVPTILSLPTWESVTKLYGDGPVVIGLETCQQFRDTIPLDDASIGTAGTKVYTYFECRNGCENLFLPSCFFVRNVQHWNQSICNVH